MALPLEGIKVLDVAQIWAMPGAARYLADQGADVIKVETLQGDEVRRLLTKPAINNESRAHWMLNRNKRGIALDLKSDRGREILLRLAREADVLIHNLRLGADKRMGIDYEAVRKINPRIIYVGFTAYGDRGPLAQARGYDMLIQAAAGVLGLRKEQDGTPIASGVWFTDLSASMLVAYAVTLALLQRARTGEGQRISGSLLQTALALQVVDMIRLRGHKDVIAGVDPALQAVLRPYPCADGKFVQCVVISDKEWHLFCEALGIGPIADDPRFSTVDARLANNAALHALIAGAFKQKTAAEWGRIALEQDIPIMPIMGQNEVFDSEQPNANDMFVRIEQPGVGTAEMVKLPFQLSGAGGYAFRPAPSLGQHTDEVLAELGLTREEIAALRAQGVVG
ncbi:MAG: CoA transferase [Candidatus Lambdaproteobacteria bacterium]|nr:CoA transferase [Candidatus Lambdaproteobacteria bacterium]